MKSLFLSLLLAFVTVSGFSGNNPAPKKINVATSKVMWKAYKVTGSHEGTVNFKGGSLDFNGDVLVGGEFTVDMTSLACTDLTGGGKTGLEGHLKSPDFFGTDSNPSAMLKITKVASRGKAGEYKVTANLTIKGITKEIKFNANIVGNTATAALKVDRSDYDVKYGSGSFVDNLGDKTIYDEFDLNISINF
jgi:polyisoprenoid-binding protein YceI